ncbi:MAG: 4-hydroxythreonine-4-phosphate dehydrogenase PdxA [Candidatus Cloacimonadota bacterium]|nr:4-hydroxythreonine-4-phosphate dehydrogenase PdxA [Candidatus Cloacimonadota bacterium]
MKILAITTGDPAGIGPEITSKAIRFLKLRKDIIFIVYGKLGLFNDGNPVVKIDNIKEATSSENIYWIEIDNEVEIGKPTTESGKIAYDILSRCADDLNSEQLTAVVTASVSKDAIRHTKPNFIGHTEFFATSSNTENVIMSFWGPHFNLSLLSTHIAVSEVSKYLTSGSLKPKFRLIHQETNKMIKNPKIAMLAVNPHAGENGAFGNEDQLITTVLEELKDEDIHIDGPYPADTFFATRATTYDMIISAYHDQGLIPFKMISADEGVNVTLGLPFIRTSVDHGTAYDIAGKGIASEKSLLQAISFAEKMISKPEEITNNNYRIFAEYYDNYMKHVGYENWVDFILSQYNKTCGKSPDKILELACGSANISSLLVKKGLKVDASDISPEMLKIASEKPFPPYLKLQKMTDKLPKHKYDLTILLFDSLNYLHDLYEVGLLFNNVHNTLVEKGLFIFDITTPKNCEKHFDGFINMEQINDDLFIHESDYEQSENTLISKLTFFKKKGFLFTRYDEEHKQKIFRVSDLLKRINNTEFKLKGIYCIGHDENLIDHNPKILESNFSRLFFVLEK